MTVAELLKANGIADDVIEKITAAMKENKLYTANEENLDVRYGKLKTDHEGTVKQLGEANTLIEELKKSNKGNDELQNKITTYEGQVQELQNELQQTKLDAAVKVALLSEKAVDVDYLTFKLKEKGELALDENEKVKNWGDKLAGLKTQFPNMFESSTSKSYKENKLPDNHDEDKGMTKTDIFKMSYQERAKFQSENPQEYETIMKG